MPLTEQISSAFGGTATAFAAWFVTAGHPLVQQRFYAAIDSAGVLCWTDGPASAEPFPDRRAAECFAQAVCPDEEWTVTSC